MIKQSCRRCGIEYGLDEKHPDNGCTPSASGPATTSRCERCPNARTVYRLDRGETGGKVCRRTGNDVSTCIMEGRTPGECPLAGK